MANIQREQAINVDLQKPGVVQVREDTLYYQDSQANRISAVIKNGTSNVDMRNGSVSGYILYPETNKYQVFPGYISNTSPYNKIYVDQPDEAYATPGEVTVSIIYTSGTRQITVVAVKLHVENTTGTVIVGPVTIGNNINDLQAHLDELMDIYDEATKVTPKAGVTGTEIATVENIKTGTTSKIYAPQVGLTTSSESNSTTTALTPYSLNTFAQLAVTGASAFSTNNTYSVGNLVRYNYNTYRCHTAVTTPGEWTGSANWTVLNSLQAQIDNVAKHATTSQYGITQLEKGSQSTSDTTALTPSSQNDFAKDVITGADPYLRSRVYNVGDRVRHDGKLWECTSFQMPGDFDENSWTAFDPLQTQIDNISLSVPNATTSQYGKTMLANKLSTDQTKSLTPYSLNAYSKSVIGPDQYAPGDGYPKGAQVIGPLDNYQYRSNVAIPNGEAWVPSHWDRVDSLQAQIDSIASGGGGASIPYGTCDSNEYGQIKDVTISGVTQLTDGMMIRVHFSTPQNYDGQPTLRLNSDSATDTPISFSTSIDADKGAWEAGDELLLAYHYYSAAIRMWEIVGHGPASSTAYGLMSPSDKKKLDTLEHGSQNIMLDWLEPEIDDEWGASCTITRNVKMAIGNLDDVFDTKYVYNATRVQHSKSTAYNSDKIVFTIGGQAWNMVNNMETGENGKKYVFSIWVKNNHATNSLEIMNGLNNALSTPIEPGETRLYSRIETASTSDPSHLPFLRFDFIAPAGTNGIDITFFQPSITEGLYKTENVLNLSTATEYASGYMSKADKAMLNILSGMDEDDFVDFRNTSTFTNSSAGKLRRCGYVVNLNFIGYLAASMSAGVSVTGGTLPVQYRPAENITFTCCTNEASGPKVIRCDINTSGVITLTSSATVSSGTAILANTSWIVPMQ